MLLRLVARDNTNRQLVLKELVWEMEAKANRISLVPRLPRLSQRYGDCELSTWNFQGHHSLGNSTHLESGPGRKRFGLKRFGPSRSRPPLPVEGGLKPPPGERGGDAEEGERRRGK